MRHMACTTTCSLAVDGWVLLLAAVLSVLLAVAHLSLFTPAHYMLTCILQPKEVTEIRDFLNIARRADAKCKCCVAASVKAGRQQRRPE